MIIAIGPGSPLGIITVPSGPKTAMVSHGRGSFRLVWSHACRVGSPCPARMGGAWREPRCWVWLMTPHFQRPPRAVSVFRQPLDVSIGNIDDWLSSFKRDGTPLRGGISPKRLLRALSTRLGWPAVGISGLARFAQSSM
jgi:hypothetical protein